MNWHIPKPDFTRSSSTTSVDTDDQVSESFTMFKYPLKALVLRLILDLLFINKLMKLGGIYWIQPVCLSVHISCKLNG